MGNFYNDLFASNGDEITVAAKPDTGIVLVMEAWTRAVVFLKFRSGSRDHPVKQKEDCKFAVAVETADAPATASRQRDAGR